MRRREALATQLPYPDELAQLPDRVRKAYAFLRPLNSGKTGSTYLLQDQATRLRYCLKTISPKVAGAPERQEVRETLEKEVNILERLHHRCLPAIYDKLFTGSLPYYICTYHPGMTLKDFRASAKTLRLNEALFVIGSLIDVLEYIHKEGRTHCDLHLENIMISERVLAEGLMIIDFGSGHRDSDSDLVTPDKGFPAFKSVSALSQYRRPVSREDFSSEFKSNDFRGVASALAQMEDSFFADATLEQRLAYREFCRRLHEGHLDDWKEVKRQLEHVIDPLSLMTKVERHFVMPDGTRAAIPLPAGGAVPVGESILAVINTSSFQRLRGIRQLSFCEWFYPGATHSRFEHSLGVLGVTRQALEGLSRDPVFKAKYSEHNIAGALLAALIHDVGHYPFAHVIEHYVSARYSTNKDLRSRVHHGTHSLHLMNSDAQLKSAIEEFWGEAMPAEVHRILTGKLGALCEVLDGPIDCDKLDYLVRDAHHCGVPYGNGLDVKGVLGSYRCSVDGEHLLVDASRVHAVEGFMVVQDQMLSAVYWHETVRAVFAMFHRFLDGVIGEDTEFLTRIVDQLKLCNSESDAFRRVFQPLLEDIGQKKGVKRRDALLPLVRLHYEANFKDIYLPIATYSRSERIDPKQPHALTNVFDSIVGDPTPTGNAVTIKWDNIKRLRTCFVEAIRSKTSASVGDFDVLVDVPWGKGSNRLVRVLEADGETPSITERSHLQESIFSHPTAYAAPIRVYVSPGIFSSIEKTVRSIQLSAKEKYHDRNSSLGSGE
jgi:HD superfamily phosphohydrolase